MPHTDLHDLITRVETDITEGTHTGVGTSERVTIRRADAEALLETAHQHQTCRRRRGV
jgi:hypothetical protein